MLRILGYLRPHLRLILTLVVLAVAWQVARTSGGADYFTGERIRAMVTGFGAWGFVVFVLAFCVGQLLQVPGMVFVLVAVVAFDKLPGACAAWIGAVVAVTVSFVVVRAIGGRALTTIDHAFVQKVLAHLDQRPIRSVVLLRLVLWMAPPLNAALAMSGLRLRDYVVGSALGLILPVFLAAFCFDYLMSLCTG